MKITTTRFGELTVNKEDILTFKEGILGFENLKKFFVVDPGDSTLILWLQSTEDESIAFPIIEPKIFMQDYVVKLIPAELTSLELGSINDASIFTILTIPKDVTLMTANMKAPIVINNKTKIARQIVLQDNKLNVRCEMYKDLKRAITGFSSDDRKRSRVEQNDSPTTLTANSGEPAQKPAHPEVNAE